MRYQPMLEAIAFNMVRCKADAQDIVQETALKWLSAGPKKIENTKAYLISAVRNNCLKHIETLKNKKEELLGQHNLAEALKLFKESNLAHLDLDIDLQKALKTLQAKLEPLERAIFVLKEVFDFDYDTLQETFDKKKEHCRQLLCRAKKKLSEETSKIHFEMPDTSNFRANFKKACDLGHITDLISGLKQEVAISVGER
ncbi:sigma-70 family RNA polymerase sigma factor [Chryseolinea sp. T2]|uniref:sigma-70 family RNA polymerase sigma factor n=1 Tax=Chryseolinea sp. T2 TaxID=3129255 RepID=UPI003077E5C4